MTKKEEEFSKEKTNWDKYLFATQVQPVINLKARNLCRKPYRNHPKGCPNYGKKNICPPKAKLLYEIINPDKLIFAVWNKFDLGSHIEKMRAKHPEWTIYQLRNCLYWQGSARKELRFKVEAVLSQYQDMIALYCPEACGVDVTATMATININLEWPPENITYQVALLGYPV